jgi:hypothetical protein
MGKILALVLALADLGLLVLLLRSGDGNVLREAGLATSFLLLGAMAWVAAFFNALYGAFRYGRDWRWVLILLVFLWLPALPVLAYGVSGTYPFRRHRLTTALGKLRWSLPPADPALRASRQRTSRRLLGLRKAA